MDISVEIHCETCGSANFSLPEGTGIHAPILCNDCGGRLGAVGELQEQLMAQALGHSAEAMRRDLDRLS